MNTLESIKCPVFLAPFDAQKHIPKIFPICGHTVCKDCLVYILDMANPKCPLDKVEFDSNFQSIEAFPTNFLGKDLLEIQDKWSRCASHKEPKKMICITDNTIICGNCAIFGDHKGHEIKSLSDFEELIDIKKTQLSNISYKTSSATSYLIHSFEEKKRNMKRTIKERFKRLHATITRQESHMLFKLENMLVKEETKQALIFLEMRLRIKVKLSQFDNILSNPKIATVLEEDFTELETTIKEKFATTNSQTTEQLSNLFALFEQSLPKEDLLKDLDIINLFEFEENMKDDLALQQLICSSSRLIFSQNEGILRVQEGTRSNPFLFLSSALEQVQEVEYKLALYDESDGENRALVTLIRLSKFLPNLKSVKLFRDPCCYSAIHANRILYNFLSAILSQPENLEKLQIHCGGAVLVENSPFIFLAEEVLPKIRDLKNLSLILAKTQISSQFLKVLTQIDFAKAWPNLETFRLDIVEASYLNEKETSEFLSVIPNVNDLLLGFGKTQLTDQSIEIFTMKVLPSLDKLEQLEVSFSDTKLTSSGVEKFLMNLPSVKKLRVGMDNLNITDDLIKTFLEKKMPSLIRLEELEFGLAGTSISENVLEQLENCL